MVFIKNFINKIKDKFKTEGSFREAITTWNVSNAYSNKNGKKFEKLLETFSVETSMYSLTFVCAPGFQVKFQLGV